MILIDANILMYAAGQPHPNKVPSALVLEKIAAGSIEACVSSEILQEILHRYRAIGRWTDGRTVYDLTRRIITVTVPIEASIVDRARELMDIYPTLMARDCIHAATCRVLRLDGICSHDADFDIIKELRRIAPQELVS